MTINDNKLKVTEYLGGAWTPALECSTCFTIQWTEDVSFRCETTNSISSSWPLLRVVHASLQETLESFLRPLDRVIPDEPFATVQYPLLQLEVSQKLGSYDFREVGDRARFASDLEGVGVDYCKEGVSYPDARRLLRARPPRVAWGRVDSVIRLVAMESVELGDERASILAAHEIAGLTGSSLKLAQLALAALL